MQYALWGAVVATLLLAAASTWFERRRTRRTDADRVGVIPWPLVQFIALFAAAICGGLALHLF